MAPELLKLIRDHSQPLEPLPAGLPASLTPQPGIRAVLFDVYGTLLISASGDIGSDDSGGRARAASAALAAVGMAGEPEAVAAQVEWEIRARHVEAKARGVAYPEVDIVEIWQNALAALGLPPLGDPELRTLATAFEVRANPVWPMPHAEELLDRLAAAPLALGIVSNAQFFTPLLFPALLGRSLEEFGFAPGLQYFSYAHGWAKPSTRLYELAAAALLRWGIVPAETLYVGNDLLNDITPAAAVGFRTALFAGDRRSLRLRSGDERVQGVAADVVVTDLAQLAEVLQIA